MIKSILKEFLIGIGLCIIILLLMGIMFYKYIPVSQTIPEVSKYERAESLEEELRISTELNKTTTIVTYDIGKTELNKFRNSNKLIQGKPNPFAVSSSGSVSGNNSENNTDNNTNNNNVNTNNEESYSKDPNSK